MKDNFLILTLPVHDLSPMIKRDRLGHDRMVVGFTTTYAMVSITTDVVDLTPAHGYVYTIM